MTAALEPVEVSVVLPCLNEAETVEVCVRKALSGMATLGVVGEVVVADNGSVDGSQAIAEAAGARVVHAPIRGYGGALMAGIEAARGQFVIMGDADDSYDLEHLGPFIADLRAGQDLVMGNRFRGGIEPGAMPRLHRYLGNPVLSWLGRVLFGLRRVGDFHCGLRGFRRDRILALGLCMPGMEFASEIVIRSALAGYAITEVPTTLRPDGRSRPPHLRTWRDGWRHLRFLLMFAPGKTLIGPGLVLTVLGLAGTAWLLPQEQHVGEVTFDVNALTYACVAVLVGVQLLLFGGFARLYGIQEGITSAHKHASWSHVFRFEWCVGVGLLVLALGAAGSAYAVGLWGDTGFGALDPRASIRIVVPSATAIALGMIIIFSGLFASLLTLRAAGPRASALAPGEVAQASSVAKP